jgi:hypothetical protein
VQKYLILTIFFLNAHTLWAQNPYSFNGTITDPDGEALVFIAVLPNDDATKGVLSDIEGRFSISLNSPILSLTFRAVGVQTLRLETKSLDKNQPLSPEGIGISFLNIKLKKVDNLINEVIISAGEDPADRLMRRVIANRNKNNPEKLNTFQCKTYNKMAFELVPNDSIFKQKLSKEDTANKNIEDSLKTSKKRRAMLKTMKFS